MFWSRLSIENLTKELDDETLKRVFNRGITNYIRHSAGAIHANVIYDVSVLYIGDYDLIYSFSMVFADPGGIKSSSDLISTGPANDVIAEQLECPQCSPVNRFWKLKSDGPMSLTWDPS